GRGLGAGDQGAAAWRDLRDGQLRRYLRAAPRGRGRGHAGAHRPALRRPGLRVPRPGRQHDPVLPEQGQLAPAPTGPPPGKPQVRSPRFVLPSGAVTPSPLQVVRAPPGLVWRALDSGQVVGTIRAHLMPDGRWHVGFEPCRDDAYEPLLDAVAA